MTVSQTCLIRTTVVVSVTKVAELSYLRTESVRYRDR